MIESSLNPEIQLQTWVISLLIPHAVQLSGESSQVEHYGEHSKLRNNNNNYNGKYDSLNLIFV